MVKGGKYRLVVHMPFFVCIGWILKKAHRRRRLLLKQQQRTYGRHTSAYQIEEEGKEAYTNKNVHIREEYERYTYTTHDIRQPQTRSGIAAQQGP